VIAVKLGNQHVRSEMENCDQQRELELKKYTQ
jgi:hypothetical protein